MLRIVECKEKSTEERERERERERGPDYIDRDPLVLPVLPLYDSRSSAVKGS
jgi:hypothetical protein